MTYTTKRKTVSYIVRIWAEYLDESPPRWRGVVETVRDGEQIHFTELSQVLSIIQQKTQSLNHEKNKP